MRKLVFVLLISAVSVIVGCGGGGSSSSSSSTPVSSPGGNTIVTSGNNVAALTVDAGPVASNPQANVAFVTVMVCSPGSTTNCVTIDHVAVDTGSTGLRVPASLLSSLNLQNVNATVPVAECVQFLDNSFFWGSVRTADVKVGGTNNTGEVASSVPIMMMGDPSLPSGTAIPSTCSTVTNFTGTSFSGTEEDTVAALGANGLLGVGNYQYDCDTLGEANPCVNADTLPTGTYYSCSGSICNSLAVPVAQQVRNPVSLFATDNNGVIMELPSVPVGGQPGVSTGQGSLVFGIGTQSNNSLSSSAIVLALDSNQNDADWAGFTTVYNRVSYPNNFNSIGSFIDSGSNAMFFLDQPTSGITSCSNSDFYCPSSTLNLQAVNESINGNSHGATFNVTSDNALPANDTAFSDLAGPNTPGIPDPATQAADGYFDWGLPFFYGRNVYVGIWGVTPPSGVPVGPYWAY